MIKQKKTGTYLIQAGRMTVGKACDNMKYAARIFLIFVILFGISEISYQVTAGALEKHSCDTAVPVEYLQKLDYGEIRLEAGASLLFEVQGTDMNVSEYMDVSSADTAGMTKAELEEYLNQYQLAEELVSAGLTDLKVETFERHKAVVSVSYETSETKRYQYWCMASDGVIRVYDSKKKKLILEQLFIRTRFTPSERRQLVNGLYIRDYEELIELLGTLKDVGKRPDKDRRL